MESEVNGVATAEKPNALLNGVNTESAGLGISGAIPTMANGDMRDSSDSEKETSEGGFMVAADSPSALLIESTTADGDIVIGEPTGEEKVSLCRL